MTDYYMTLEETILQPNPKYLEVIQRYETHDPIYDWVEDYILPDGSYWSYTYCCDAYEPIIMGCAEPPIHTCRTPMGYCPGWED